MGINEKIEVIKEAYRNQSPTIRGNDVFLKSLFEYKDGSQNTPYNAGTIDEVFSKCFRLGGDGVWVA